MKGLFCRSVGIWGHENTTDGQNGVFVYGEVGMCRQTIVSSPISVYPTLPVSACVGYSYTEGPYTYVYINRDPESNRGGPYCGARC